jgi:hypothetical protein
MEQHIKNEILKPREFKTRADVLGWFRELLDAGVSFHPEDRGGVLIDIETDKPTFSEAEATQYDHLMRLASDACSAAFRDVCEIACEAFDQFMADNSLAVAATAKVAQNIKVKTGDALERIVWANTPRRVLEALRDSLTVASDESRSNGPNALTPAERKLEWLRDELEGILQELEYRCE